VSIFKIGILRRKQKSSAQPFDFPPSKARGLLRVDTERRFLPHPKEPALAPSKYQIRVGIEDRLFLRCRIDERRRGICHIRLNM
jgi:hypothetical protein